LILALRAGRDPNRTAADHHEERAGGSARASSDGAHKNGAVTPPRSTAAGPSGPLAPARAAPSRVTAATGPGQPARSPAGGAQRLVVPAAPRTPELTPPLALVIFGASGDLTSRKILPALANLAERGRLNDGFTVVGVARTPWSDEEFRKVALKDVPEAGERWRRLVERFRYVPGEYAASDTFDRLGEVLSEADREYGGQ